MLHLQGRLVNDVLMVSAVIEDRYAPGYGEVNLPRAELGVVGECSCRRQRVVCECERECDCHRIRQEVHVAVDWVVLVATVVLPWW